MSKENLHLPKTIFSMKADLAKKEPDILKQWEKNNTFERIRKNGGSVYFWLLIDRAKKGPIFHGMSQITNIEGDCRSFRYKDLSYSFHKEPMGGGTGAKVFKLTNKSPRWNDPTKTVYENILKSVCNEPEKNSSIDLKKKDSANGLINDQTFQNACQSSIKMHEIFNHLLFFTISNQKITFLVC